MDEIKKDQNLDQETKINELKKQITLAEESLEAAKRALFELTGDHVIIKSSPVDHMQAKASEDGKIIEGIFNGENMVGPEGRVYPVPANYASKSKLVEGDKLKLTISDDGKFLFKQIEPIKRKTAIGTLKFENNAYHVLSEGSSYNVLYASVTFHKAKPGDKVSVIIPESRNASWAVLESIIHDMPTKGVNDTSPKDDIVQNEREEVPTPEGASQLKEDIEIKKPEETVAPEQTTSTPESIKQDSVSNQTKSKLAIDDINIGSPKKQEAPDAVNPGEVHVGQDQVSSAPPKKESKPEPATPISEMDI